MGALGLDLSSSEAKIARAREHLETLKREAQRIFAERGAYLPRISEINPDTGWCSLYLTPVDYTEYGIGIIVGDVVHNLRSALDYIVTALVEASGGIVDEGHGFPIAWDRHFYCRVVGTEKSVTPQGPLAGINVGLRQIWDLQPFHRQPDPEADPLFCVYRLSNADKHRQIVAHSPILDGPQMLQLWHPAVPVSVEEQVFLPVSDWGQYREFEVARVRFSRSLPTQVEVKYEGAVRVHLSTPAVGKHSKPFEIEAGTLVGVCDHVAMIVETFKKL